MSKCVFSTFYNLLPVSKLLLYQLGCDSASLILLWSNREYESLLLPYGRGVGGLCIIDEALYRQTELNTEMLTAQPHRPAVGGWVGGWGVWGRKQSAAGSSVDFLYLQE